MNDEAMIERLRLLNSLFKEHNITGQELVHALVGGAAVSHVRPMDLVEEVLLTIKLYAASAEQWLPIETVDEEDLNAAERHKQAGADQPATTY